MAYIHKKARMPELPEIMEPDWDLILLELLRRGFRIMAIAKHCEMARETVRNLIDGRSNPQWYSGQKLLQLYKEVVKNDTSTRVSGHALVREGS